MLAHVAALIALVRYGRSNWNRKSTVNGVDEDKAKRRIASARRLGIDDDFADVGDFWINYIVGDLSGDVQPRGSACSAYEAYDGDGYDAQFCCLAESYMEHSVDLISQAEIAAASGPTSTTQTKQTVEHVELELLKNDENTLKRLVGDLRAKIMMDAKKQTVESSDGWPNLPALWCEMRFRIALLLGNAGIVDNKGTAGVAVRSVQRIRTTHQSSATYQQTQSTS